MSRMAAAAPDDALPDQSTQPKVSVLIVSYNQENFIEESVRSAADQDYENLEVVVSDDASSDRTQDLIAELRAEYPPGRIVALLNNDNVGVTPNCNRALRACSGEFVAFSAGDDVFLPGKIQAQIDWFAADPERVLCGHQAEVFYDDGSRPPHPLPNPLRTGSGADSFIRHGGFGAVTVMVRAGALPPQGFEEALPLVSDYMLWVEVLAHGGEYGFVPGTFARYRRHGSNMSANPLKNSADVRRYFEIVAARYPRYRAACRYGMVRSFYYQTGVDLLRAGRKRESRTMFLDALRREPFYIKGWIRLAQSFA